MPKETIAVEVDIATAFRWKVASGELRERAVAMFEETLADLAAEKQEALDRLHNHTRALSDSLSEAQKRDVEQEASQRA